MSCKGSRRVLVGESTKNVRIERLWLTAAQQKFRDWRQVFLRMEREYKLPYNILKTILYLCLPKTKYYMTFL